ncbi:MAG: IS200/IS605 family transposase [Parachlamydiaceae bacterium]
MSHTYVNQFIHVLCPTKDLKDFISEDFRTLFYRYIGKIIGNNGGQCLSISGTPNHIHILLNLATNTSISAFLCKVKSNSSKWYRQSINPLFEWSSSYLAFTVSPSALNSTLKYFSDESNRHLKTIPQDEIVHFLNFQELDFQAQYLICSTHARLIYHLVWSVKNRMPMLEKSVQPLLHGKIKNVIESLGGKTYAVGNIADHIHILMECPKILATADLVANLKTSTTHLLKSESHKYKNFSWQEGYGVFSVGKPLLETCISYVDNQELHHATSSFDDEWKQLCRPSGA